MVEKFSSGIQIYVSIQNSCQAEYITILVEKSESQIHEAFPN